MLRNTGSLDPDPDFLLDPDPMNMNPKHAVERDQNRISEQIRICILRELRLQKMHIEQKQKASSRI